MEYRVWMNVHDDSYCHIRLIAEKFNVNFKPNYSTDPRYPKKSGTLIGDILENLISASKEMQALSFVTFQYDCCCTNICLPILAGKKIFDEDSTFVYKWAGYYLVIGTHNIHNDNIHHGSLKVVRFSENGPKSDTRTGYVNWIQKLVLPSIQGQQDHISKLKQDIQDHKSNILMYKGWMVEPKPKPKSQKSTSRPKPKPKFKPEWGRIFDMDCEDF